MKSLIALLFIASSFVYAGVNLKNGNYYISYTDVVIPGGGKPLRITKTYNSKSTEVGWFGFGWGSDYETFLKVSADGSVVVHENGAGAQTRFIPKVQVNTKEAAMNIVKKMREKSQMTESNANSLIAKLEKNAELRHAYARQFGVEAKLANGTELFSNERGMQRLVKTPTGYQRVYSDGKKEEFNKNGRLAKVSYKSGYFLDVLPKDRVQDSQITAIKDSAGKQVFFEWHSSGMVKALFSSKDRKAQYEYKGKDLISSTDLIGNKYLYSYDPNHNLTKITYGDKKTQEITYEPKTQFVSSVKKKNGDLTKYKYGSDPKNPDLHYWTEVTKQGLSGKPVTNYYEYEIRTKPDGQQYTYRIVTKINGIKTETIYSECCSLPLKIARGNKVTNFEYNADGLLTKKTSSAGENVELAYNNSCKKISKVLKNGKWTNFEYDKKCNLQKAVNSVGKAVFLVYDRKSRITKMVDRDNKSKKQQVLTFKYNAMGKPVEITMEKAGKINVMYDNYGSIKKVESDKGQKMALKVTRAFQNLLAIVKPAGVNLNL